MHLAAQAFLFSKQHMAQLSWDAFGSVQVQEREAGAAGVAWHGLLGNYTRSARLLVEEAPGCAASLMERNHAGRTPAEVAQRVKGARALADYLARVSPNTEL